MILSLDLGSTLGWCLASNNHKDGYINGGSLKLGYTPGMKKSAKISRVERHFSFDEFLNTQSPSYVFYEKVRHHIGVDAAHMYGGFEAQLIMWAHKNGILVGEIGVCEIKKQVSGYGRATKEDMCKAASKLEWGINPQDDNHADAMCLCYLALKRLENF